MRKKLKIFFWIGVFIILVGIAGLFLPYIQGILCLCFGINWLLVAGIVWFVNKQKKTAQLMGGKNCGGWGGETAGFISG